MVVFVRGSLSVVVVCVCLSETFYGEGGVHWERLLRADDAGDVEMIDLVSEDSD